MILSTCNRVEIYAAQSPAAALPTLSQFAQFLSEFHQVPLDEFVGELHEQTGPPVVRHLFEVVSSLDSMVLGEPQIVSQVKDCIAKGMSLEETKKAVNLDAMRTRILAGVPDRDGTFQASIMNAGIEAAYNDLKGRPEGG